MSRVGKLAWSVPAYSLHVLANKVFPFQPTYSTLMLCSSLLSLFFVKAAHIIGQVRENTLLLINHLCLRYLRILRFCSRSVAQTLFQAVFAVKG